MKVRPSDGVPKIEQGELEERAPEAKREAPSSPSTRMPDLAPTAPSSRGDPISLIAARQSSTVHPFVAEMAELSKANALRYRAENLRLLEQKGVPDPERELQRLETEMRARQQLLMRRSARGLLGLLLDGRIKTVYEVPDKRTDGQKYLEYRRETEERLGLFEHRPVYGYVSFDDRMKAAPTEFGDIVLVLKEKTYRDRAVFCEYDSFDQESLESYRSKAFVWDDVVQLVIHQTLDGTLEEMPFAYDEAQIFGPPGRPHDAVTIADVEAVEIPSDKRFDVIAAEVRRVAPWIRVTRYEREGAEEPDPIAPLEGSLDPTGDPKPVIGGMIRSSALAGWYRAEGGKMLVKPGPAHQREAEVLGSYLARAMGLRAPEVVPAEVGGTPVVAITEIPGATDVASSGFSPAQNEANLRALLDDFPEARTKLLEAFVLDLVTSNLDGAMNIMRDADGPCFVDFGGCAHSRPMGKIKEERFLDETIDIPLFLTRLSQSIGRAHPAFDATPEEMRGIARKLIDRGLLLAIADGIAKAGIGEDGPWPASKLMERLQERALFLTRAEAWK